MLHYADDTLTLHQGNSLDVLRELPTASVACIVTSPPYFALRAYGDDPDEQGAEPTVADYVAGIVAVMAECRRVLEPTGTLWLNLSDTYSGRANARTAPRSNRTRGHQHQPGVTPPQRNTIADAPFKSLLMVPEQVAFAMLQERWVLRNKITWHKTNATPEAVKDRFTTKSELIYLFTPGPRYWFNLDALREPHTMKPQRRLTPKKDRIPRAEGHPEQTWSNWTRDTAKADGHPLGRNPGDHWAIVDEDDFDPAEHMDETWVIPTAPFPGAHFATMTPEVARRCIVAGARPGGTVLDPYSGSGTTGMVAAKHGNPYVGIDLYPSNLDLSLRTRLTNGVLI